MMFLKLPVITTGPTQMKRDCKGTTKSVNRKKTLFFLPGGANRDGAAVPEGHDSR